MDESWVDTVMPRSPGRARVRQYRQAKGDGLGFLPWGLIPALGLTFVLFQGWGSFARGIEDQTRSAAQEALTEAGADWARPIVSGQWVMIEGRPPTEEAGDRAIAAVRNIRAPTWLGGARPVTRVRASYIAGTPPIAAASAPSPVSLDRYQWLYRLTAENVTLEGRVPDATTRKLITDAAAATFTPPRTGAIKDELVIDPGVAPEGFSNIALRGLAILDKCTAGTASFADAAFEVRCTLPAAEKSGADSLARAPLPYGTLGDVSLLASEEIASCEARLATLLDASRIEFDSGSARLAATSSPILDRVARDAAACPGTLRIEGHTDNTGLARTNLDLSLARAEAVRAALIARGLDASRLVANGYGAGRPRALNNTTDGRARNRRIEIRVVTDGND